MNEITAEMVTELRLHYEQLLVVLATPPASNSPAELRALLQEARDHIGTMPSLDSDGNDRFLSTLRLVERIETTLAGSPAAGVLEGWPTEQQIENGARALWEDGAAGEPQYQFPTREARYRAAKAVLLAAAPSPPVPAQPWQWQQLRELLKPFADAVTDEPEGRYVNTAGPTVEDWYALADAYAWSAPVPPQDAGVEAMQHALDYLDAREDLRASVIADELRDALSRHAPAPGQVGKDEAWWAANDKLAAKLDEDADCKSVYSDHGGIAVALTAIAEIDRLRALAGQPRPSDNRMREAREALRPFAEVINVLDHIQELDRDAKIATVHINGPGASGGCSLLAEDFQQAERVWRVLQSPARSGEGGRE